MSYEDKRAGVNVEIIEEKYWYKESLFIKGIGGKSKCWSTT